MVCVLEEERKKLLECRSMGNVFLFWNFVWVLVGVLATAILFVLSWLIYSVVELNRKIERLKDKLEEAEQSRWEACHYSHWGMAEACMSKNDFVGAFRYYLSALSHALKMDTPMNVVRLMGAVLSAIESVPQSQKLAGSLRDEVEKIDKEIRKSKFFSAIQDEYEKAYSKFKEKVDG